MPLPYRYPLLLLCQSRWHWASGPHRNRVSRRASVDFDYWRKGKNIVSTKSDYTQEEWQLLLDVPPLVGTAVMVAGRSGLGSMKEAFALASSVLGGKKGFENNTLVGALVDGRLKDGDRSAIENFSSNPYRGLPPEEILAAAVEKSRAVLELLAVKSQPQESHEYRGWAMSIGDKVANAAKEGGFLGIGGERVSEEEKRVLDAVADALDISWPLEA